MEIIEKLTVEYNFAEHLSATYLKRRKFNNIIITCPPTTLNYVKLITKDFLSLLYFKY